MTIETLQRIRLYTVAGAVLLIAVDIWRVAAERLTLLVDALWGFNAGLALAWYLEHRWKRPTVYVAQMQVRVNGSLVVNEPISIYRDGIIGMEVILEHGKPQEGIVEFLPRRPSSN